MNDATSAGHYYRSSQTDTVQDSLGPACIGLYFHNSKYFL